MQLRKTWILKRETNLYIESEPQVFMPLFLNVLPTETLADTDF